MYNYFKSVLKVTKERHNKVLQGKSGIQKKLQRELLNILCQMQRCYLQDKTLTADEYKELSREFGKISFLNLSEQRKGNMKI